MIIPALLLTNEEKTLCQVRFMNNESLDRKTINTKASLVYYSLFYQNYVENIPESTMSRVLLLPDIFSISIATVPNIYICNTLDFF